MSGLHQLMKIHWWVIYWWVFLKPMMEGGWMGLIPKLLNQSHKVNIDENMKYSSSEYSINFSFVDSLASGHKIAMLYISNSC